MKKYYEAYDKRYGAVHEKGLRWTHDINTPAVLQILKKYCKKIKKIKNI